MPVDLHDLGSFGRYRLIRRISLGGMAEVFKAKSYNEHGFEKVVALKRLLPLVSANADFIQMFVQEARLAARLDHVNICRIYELGKVEEDYYLTMEFIYGHDLRQVAKACKRRKSRMDPWVAAFVATQVAEGLDYAYRATASSGQQLCTVHRDISPQNIMLGFDGRAKIIDFGIAKSVGATVQTAAGVLKGKYAYMAPEHAEKRSLDERADIWSLGVVVHELLAGRRLFVGTSIADTVDEVLHRPVPPLEDVPEELADIIRRMLQRDRSQRFATHSEVAGALHGFLARSPIPVTENLVVRWMDGLFPARERLESDLTEDDVRVVMSAEERGEETTDVRSDVSSATEIFVADETGQADYREILRRLLDQGRVRTGVASVGDGAPGPPASSRPRAPPASCGERSREVLWDALLCAMAFVSLGWLLLAMLRLS